MINQFFADKKFILLFKIGSFHTSLPIEEALCKSLRTYGLKVREDEKLKKRKVKEYYEEKRKGKGDILQWEKNVKREEQTDLIVSDGERERRSEG